MKTTVVVPVFGNWQILRRAVSALEPELGPDRELVLVDDASPESGPAGLPGTIVRNEENQGFGPSCNRGAEIATGQYLCLLNSDSSVEPGTLERLERRADQAGAVVTALLVGADGAIQEAGCAIGSDGVTYPLGVGLQPEDPVWTFFREVDYGSGACLFVSRAEFLEVGGFDDDFAPGYYEDADLCLRLADRGTRTVLEPTARVTHLQYGSGSQERAKRLVRRNRETFLMRWGARIAHRPVVIGSEPWPHRLLALRDARTLLRFLVFEDSELAADISRRWPAARVTLVGSDGILDGVEIARPDDLDSWLEQRRFHYSAVLNADPALDDALRRSQPQAARDLEDPILPPAGAEPRG